MNAVLEPRTVGELMTRDPILAHLDMALSDAADLMDFYRVTGLPVVDSSGALCGVISQTDLLHARTTEALWAAWPGLAVRHLMTSPAVTVTAGTSVDEAAALMERLRIHRVVVTDISGEVTIGILAVADLVRAMAERGPA
ncbi:MAG TPA: CBS domain-containing protein [Candidatus Limnocylindrales bacterium]|nr:CBS domain-containing protein [Candidatus Limnocylindrales bacterium]